jgi:hypothetical protein
MWSRQTKYLYAKFMDSEACGPVQILCAKQGPEMQKMDKHTEVRKA